MAIYLQYGSFEDGHLVLLAERFRHVQVAFGGHLSITRTLILRCFVCDGRSSNFFCVPGLVISDYTGRARDKARTRVDVCRQ